MAKQVSDTYTLDLLDKPKRGRPRKPDAKTPAQRAREYRARQRADKQPVRWNMFTWISDLAARKPECRYTWNRPYVCSHDRNWEDEVCPICCMYQDDLLPHRAARNAR